MSAVRRFSIWLCRYFSSSRPWPDRLFEESAIDFELGPPNAGAGSRDKSSAGLLSREMEVASVDAELKTPQPKMSWTMQPPWNLVWRQCCAWMRSCAACSEGETQQQYQG